MEIPQRVFRRSPLPFLFLTTSTDRMYRTHQELGSITPPTSWPTSWQRGLFSSWMPGK